MTTVKELKAEIETLKQHIAALEMRLNTVELKAAVQPINPNVTPSPWPGLGVPYPGTTTYPYPGWTPPWHSPNIMLAQGSGVLA